MVPCRQDYSRHHSRERPMRRQREFFSSARPVRSRPPDIGRLQEAVTGHRSERSSRRAGRLPPARRGPRLRVCWWRQAWPALCLPSRSRRSVISAYPGTMWRLSREVSGAKPVAVCLSSRASATAILKSSKASAGRPGPTSTTFCHAPLVQAPGGGDPFGGGQGRADYVRIAWRAPASPTPRLSLIAKINCIRRPGCLPPTGAGPISQSTARRPP